MPVSSKLTEEGEDAFSSVELLSTKSTGCLLNIANHNVLLISFCTGQRAQNLKLIH